MGLFDGQIDCKICGRPVKDGKIINFNAVCNQCAKDLK